MIVLPEEDENLIIDADATAYLDQKLLAAELNNGRKYW